MAASAPRPSYGDAPSAVLPITRRRPIRAIRTPISADTAVFADQQGSASDPGRTAPTSYDDDPRVGAPIDDPARRARRSTIAGRRAAPPINVTRAPGAPTTTRTPLVATTTRTLRVPLAVRATPYGDRGASRSEPRRPTRTILAAFAAGDGSDSGARARRRPAGAGLRPRLVGDRLGSLGPRGRRGLASRPGRRGSAAAGADGSPSDGSLVLGRSRRHAPRRTPARSSASRTRTTRPTSRLPQAVRPGDAVRVARMDAEVLVVDGRPRYHLADCPHLIGRADRAAAGQRGGGAGLQPVRLVPPGGSPGRPGRPPLTPRPDACRSRVR